MSRFYILRPPERGREDEPTVDGQGLFGCDLSSERCAYVNPYTGRQCSRNVVIGLPECWQHRRKNLHVIVKDSNIPGAGKGLFAYNPALAGTRTPVFKRNQKIVGYQGELLSNAEVDNRYGNATGPYALSISADNVVDAACRRSLGSLVNTATGSRFANNARLGTNYGNRIGTVKAIRPIYHGEEILASYGNRYRLVEPRVASRTERGRFQAVQNRFERQLRVQRNRGLN